MIQDRTQSWRSLLFKVFYCVCHVFSSTFLQVSSSKTEKKNKILNIAEANAHLQFIFLALRVNHKGQLLFVTIIGQFIPYKGPLFQETSTYP